MKKRIVILLLVAVVVIAIVAGFFIPTRIDNRPSSLGASSTQEEIDTSISLMPSSSTAPLTLSPPASVSPPAPVPVYGGCALNLTFAITGGNLSASGVMQYDLLSENLGNTTCASPSISVYYANDESYSSSNPAATADGYYWKIPDLLPGAKYNITLTTDRNAPLAAGAVVDEACLSANNGTDACGNASTNPSSQSLAARVAVSAVAAPPDSTLTSFDVPSGKELGVWIWTPVDQMTGAMMQQYISAAAANHFNAIYLTIDDYLDATDTAGYAQSLENFIALANRNGISVDAEAGWRDWAEAGNTSSAGTIMSFVGSFNQSHSAKFRGIQYDVESYLLPQYQNDQTGVLTDYVNLIESLVDQDKTIQLPLTIIVPDFYTATQQWTPEITVDGVTAYAYDQLVRLLGELSGSRIIVMAYRNVVSGPNGSVALAAPEVQGADGLNVTVLVAQETGPVSPSYVTFNGLPRSNLFGAAEQIDESFASDTSFGGIAVDYLDPFLTLQ